MPSNTTTTETPRHRRRRGSSERRDPGTYWFWADWLSDPCLRLCSTLARGLWIDMLCLAGMSSEYGFVLIGGEPVTDEDLAGITRLGIEDVHKCVEELEKKKVFSRDNRQRIYCRRMVREANESRQKSEAGRIGGQLSQAARKENSVRLLDEHKQNGQADVEAPAQAQSEANSEARARAPSPPSLPNQPTQPPNGGGETHTPEPQRPASIDADTIMELGKKIATRMGLDLTSSTNRYSWPREIGAALASGLTADELLEAADIAKGRGKDSLAYVVVTARRRAEEAAQPVTPVKRPNGNGNGAHAVASTPEKPPHPDLPEGFAALQPQAWRFVLDAYEQTGHWEHRYGNPETQQALIGVSNKDRDRWIEITARIKNGKIVPMTAAELKEFWRS